MDRVVALCSGLALVLYLNTLPAEFAYDDSRAILKNPDLLPDTPLSSIFYDDFWGTPLTNTGSHKSYRPLCVLTFRLNYQLAGHRPFVYHLTNVVLHAVVTGVFVHTLRAAVDGRRPRRRCHRRRRHDLIVVVSGLLFAAHPVHVEAVAGVVGRADVLSCLFFLVAFRLYVAYCRSRDAGTEVVVRRRSRGSTPPSSSPSSPGAAAAEDWPSKGPHQNGTAIKNGRRRRDNDDKDCADGVAVEGGDDGRWKRWLYAGGCVVFSAASMLSKEHGITVLAICVVYDVFVEHRLALGTVRTSFKHLRWRSLSEGLVIVLITAAGLVGLRVALMGCRAPEFSPSDNPASDSDSALTRLLTFAYLPVVNFWLLLCPSRLSFDWSMGSIPLIESLLDVRNALTTTFYAGLIGVAMIVLRSVDAVNRRRRLGDASGGGRGSTSNGHQRPTVDEAVVGGRTAVDDSLRHRGASNGSVASPWSEVVDGDRRSAANQTFQTATDVDDDSADVVDRSHVTLLSIALLVVPFVPASNLFFYVGFVVAERVLYIPSMGFCVLVGVGVERIVDVLERRRQAVALRCVRVSVLLLLASFGLRTLLRNGDWMTEEALYRSGIAINPAKAWGNLANVLNAQGRSSEAEQAYKAALTYRSNMADVHYNLGILYQEQGRFTDAIHSYQLAIQCRPRLTMAHLNLGIVLALVGRKTEAEQVYRYCSLINIAGLKDPRLHEQTKISALYNLGRLFDEQGRYQEAVDVYLEAVEKLPSHYAPQSLYNMLGEAYSKISDWKKAEFWYREALRVKPDHIPAHLTLAKLLQKQGKLRLAEKLFLKARQIDPDDYSVHQHYGQYLVDVGRHVEAAESYLTAAAMSPTDFELIFNTASALRQAGRNIEAESFYRRSVELRPDMALAHMNLGAMLHYNGKLLDAEASYLTALRLQPNDDVTRANLNKLRNRLRRH